MKKLLPVTLLVVLLLTGCVHHSPFTEEYLFQAMGADGEIVVTADVAALKSQDGGLVGFDDGLLAELKERTDRLSLALYKDSYSEEDPYPAAISDLDYYGALEGNYGKGLNTLISWSEEFHKETADGIRYYTDDNGSIELAVPETGVMLFASKDYEMAYHRLISDRVIYIPEDTAATIGSALFGLYVRSPQTMIELGFELPQTVIMQMSDAIIYVVETDGVYYLNADITMQDESLAKTLLTLLRNQVVAEIRRQGERPDFAALSQQYLQSGRVVSVRDRVMGEAEKNSFMEKIQSAAGGLI